MRRPLAVRSSPHWLVALPFLALACGGAGNPSGSGGCSGSCGPAALSEDDVRRVIAQAASAADQVGLRATISVVDRVGNVLAVFRMSGAPEATTVVGTPSEGLEGATVDSALASISKAGTGAYLSSQGNAFTTTTASQIVQQNFNPEELGQPGGPLFGVQFSQLPCGDLGARFGDGSAQTGPKRLPLGLSADPGGLPLYKTDPTSPEQGRVVVGGIGIEGNGTYGLSTPNAPEERVAQAASRGFEAPAERRANRIFVIGRSLRFVASEPAPPGVVASIDDLEGSLIAVPGFADAVLTAGTAFTTSASGVVPTTFEGLAAEILVNADGVPRFPPRAASTPGGLTQAEVTALLAQAQLVASRSRAQIRTPLGTSVRVSVSIVGLNGEILGILRSPDAPVFGIDVSLQKARTAMFFSSQNAGSDLIQANLGSYVAAVRTFLNDPTALTGNVAFADRSGGNLSRPFFPDGINGNPNGPFSKPIAEWSPFNTGLQLDISQPGILDVLAGGSPSVCNTALPTLGNGMQIFPGSVPVYRGSTLVGGIGVSGDGVDQDDMVAFLGVHRAGQQTGTINNAPRAIRADQIEVRGTRLRYVNCPPQPFLDSDQQEACNGL